MKKLLLAFLVTAFVCLGKANYAQNIEGQIIASQYGTWQVPITTPNSYAFTPTSCRVQGGASFFFAFATGTPLKIVDGNPALTEFVTPTNVVDTNDTCAISIAPVNAHQSPSYIASGTGGLQEAINQNLTTPATNTIVLSAAWYQSVGAANVATIIAAAKGSTRLGLVDVTTVPTSYYSWNGSQYVAVSSGGGASSPATPLVLKGSGGPNGIIAATPGTDYVIPSGSILGSAAGTVPNTPLVLKGSGTIGVSVPAVPGTDYVLPSGSITGSSGTAGALSGTPSLCPSGQAPIGILPNGNATGCAPISGGGGITGGPFNVAKYSSTVGPSGPSPNLFGIDNTTTLAQMNALIASLNCGTSCQAPPGGQGTIIVPDGVLPMGWTNQTSTAGSGNPGVGIDDIRLGVHTTPLSTWGVACNGQNSGSYTLTSGSTTVVPVFTSFSQADVGSTIAVVGTLDGLPTRFMPTITAVSGGNATISTPAPFSGTYPGERGFLNTANLQTAMDALAGRDLVGQFPSGCGILTDTVLWKGTSLVGDAEESSIIFGVPGDDIFQTPDTSGPSTISSILRFGNVGLILDNSIDATKPWQAIDANGTKVSKTPLYRPVAAKTTTANNPLAPGWALNATNGVAKTTQNSALICVPTSLGRMPVVGQQIVFRDFASIFESTVSSLSGSCSSGFSPATMANALPNVTGYTQTQAEWVSTSAIQSLAVAIPAGAISYPLTITVATSTAPIPVYESNVATHGRVKIGPYEADYIGGSTTFPYTLILRAGPGTVTSTLPIGTPVVPENPCYEAYETPWPVTPTINSGDSTPSGATYFPGMCVGNSGIAMPQANANVHVGTGLVRALIENIGVNASGLTGNATANNTGCYYVAGNNASYSTTYQNISCNNTTFGIVQGPASAGQHGVSTVGPSGDGNHYSDLHLLTAYGLIFDQLEDSTIQRVDGTTSLVNQFDGTTIGSATTFIWSPTYDEQTGNAVSIASFDQLSNFNIEPGNGTHAEIPPYAIFDCFTCTYDNDSFEGVPSYIGGSGNVFNSGQLSAPSYNYGANNVVKFSVGASSGNLTAGSQTGSIINWGTEFTQSVPIGEGQAGPNLWGTNNVRSSSDGQNQEFAYMGNFAAPPVDTRGGMIYPDEFVTNRTIESNPMTVGPTYDPTALVTGGYIGCILGGGASCNTTHFDGLNQLFIGPQNRIPADKTLLSMMVKGSSASTFTVTIAALANGSCSGAFVLSQTFNATTSWAPVEFPVDFTGQSGCTLGININGGSSATYDFQYFDFLPLPSRVLLRPTTYTSGAACTATGISGIDATNMYVCVGGTIHVVSLNASANTQTICSTSIMLSGSLTTGTQGSVGSGTCTGAAVGDTAVCSTGTNIFTTAPFTPTTSGTPTLAIQVTANTVTFNAENNTATTQAISGPNYTCKVFR